MQNQRGLRRTISCLSSGRAQTQLPGSEREGDMMGLMGEEILSKMSLWQAIFQPPLPQLVQEWA